jgi:hypothetical protein
MRTLLTILSVAALFLVSGCMDIVNDPLPTHYDDSITVLSNGEGEKFGEELFPWKTGDQWLYYSQDDYLYIRPTDETISTNGRASTLTQFVEAGFTFEHYIRVDSGAVRDYGSQFKWWPCSMPRLHFPIRVGKKWKVGDPYGDMRAEATVESVEVVDTPMGAFNAVKVHYYVRNAADEEAMHQWMWFVPGIGMVRWKHSFGWGIYPWMSEDDWLLRHFEVEGYEAERAAARVR